MSRKKCNPAFPGSNTLLVLALLEDEDKYGYQIIRELECRSDQTFSMKEGTLYPIVGDIINLPAKASKRWLAAGANGNPSASNLAR